MAAYYYDYRIAEVIRVVDGDTVDLRIDAGFHMTLALRFRLLGVDAPERGAEGWGEATRFTQVWLDLHRRHELRARTSKGDSFGRWLAELYCGTCPHEEDLGAALVTAGCAVAWRRR